MTAGTLVQALVGAAFARASPAEANAAIEAQRVARGGPGAPALSYEVALPALDPDGYLAGKVLSKLVYFLDCRGVRLPESGGVFVSLFTAEGLLFVDAGQMVALLAGARGLTVEEVVRRYGEDGAGDPALLTGQP